jgi:WXG100 family type VII secretion target
MYDPDRHAELAELLARVAASIQTELDMLAVEAGSLASHWSGEAKDAYARAQRDWSAAMVRLGAALNSSTKAAEAAGTQLAQADQDAASTWQ